MVPGSVLEIVAVSSSGGPGAFTRAALLTSIRFEKPLPQPTAAPAEGDASRDADLVDVWRILWHARRLLLATAALGFAVAALYALLTPRLYTADAQLFVDPRELQVVNNGINPGTMAPDGGITQIESQLRVLESDVVLLRAVTTAGLASDPEFGAAPDGLLSQAGRAFSAQVGLGPRDPDTTPELRALNRLKRSLAIKRADKVFVLDVAATAKSPDKAARIANAVVEGYLADQAGARSSASNQASSELTGRLAELRNKLRVAENAVETYREQHKILSSSGALVKDQELNALNLQLVGASSHTAEARAKVDQIERARRNGGDLDAMPEAVQTPAIVQLRAQFAQIARQKADLETQLGDRHPSLAAIKAQLVDVKRLIVAELDRVARSVRNDYDRAQDNERALRGQLAALEGEAVTTSQASVRLRELDRDVDANRAVYEAFLVRARETGEQASINSTNARIITVAVPPERASWPPTLLLSLGALALGAGLGAAIALMREYATPTVLTPAQLMRATGVPIVSIGPVPAKAPRRGRLFEGARGIEGAFGLLQARFKGGRSGGKAPVLLLASADRDRLARTRLCGALAASAAAQGRHVLLVDADFRHRTLSSLVAEPAHAGLLDVLNGRESLDRAVVEDRETGIMILPLGTGRSAPAVVSGDNLQQFLAMAGRYFDAILFDAGGLGEDARAAALAGGLGDVVLAAFAGRTRQRDVAAALDSARAAGSAVPTALFVFSGRRVG